MDVEKRKLPKVVPNSMLAGGGIGALVAWAWNGIFPEYPMTAEVAAVAGATVIGPIVAYIVSWVPKPEENA